MGDNGGGVPDALAAHIFTPFFTTKKQGGSMYFDDDTANVPGSSDHGEPRVIAGLGAVALVILLLAATN